MCGMKNNTIAVRIAESFRLDIDNLAADLGVSSSELCRYMMLYCMRLNADASRYEPKSDFLAFAKRRAEMALF